MQRSSPEHKEDDIGVDMLKAEFPTDPNGPPT